MRRLHGSVGPWITWVKFLRGLRGLRGSKYFLRGSYILRGLRGSNMFLLGSKFCAWVIFFYVDPNFLRELKFFAGV